MLEDAPHGAANIVKMSPVIYATAAKRDIYGCEWAAGVTNKWRGWVLGACRCPWAALPAAAQPGDTRHLPHCCHSLTSHKVGG